MTQLYYIATRLIGPDPRMASTEHIAVRSRQSDVLVWSWYEAVSELRIVLGCAGLRQPGAAAATVKQLVSTFLFGYLESS
jgi:hypothetical protein